MAQLTIEQKNSLTAELQRLFSSICADELHHLFHSLCAAVPLIKTELRVAVDEYDNVLETAEQTILVNVSPAARTWLAANPKLMRFVLESVAQKRREVL